MKELQSFFSVNKIEKEQILENCNKTQSDVDTDVEILNTWFRKQAHLPRIEDDIFFESFLLRNKFQVERTKEKIDKYFSMKNVYSDFFDKLDPCDENIVAAAKYFRIAMMPKLTPEMRRIVYIQLKLDNENDFNHAAMTYYLIIATETQLRLDYTDAIELVMDAADVNMGLLPKIDIAVFSKSMKIYFDAFSGRIGGLHILNASSAVEMLLSMFKPFLPAKVKNRIQIHSEPSDIFKFIPKNCLPLEIGGTSDSASESASDFARALQNSRSYIMKRNKLYSNENLRIGNRPNQSNLFGIEGTFKKINID